MKTSSEEVFILFVFSEGIRCLHRDGLGTVQPIRPGEVNWMTAGRGIAHSERTPQEMRLSGSKLFGIQSWVAMPKRYEESDPTFTHHGAEELPVVEGEGKRVRIKQAKEDWKAGRFAPVPEETEFIPLPRSGLPSCGIPSV